MTRGSILVVDDDEDIRFSLCDVLEDLDFRSTPARNGQEALELLRDPSRPPPSLILLDLMMPVMNGWQFLEARAQDLQLAAIPVVVMTAAVQTHRPLPEVVRTFAKPFTVQQLEELLVAMH